MKILKKVALFLPITLIVLQCLFVVGLKYEKRLATERSSFTILLIRAVHGFMPELFWKRNLRVIYGGFRWQVRGYVDKHSVASGEEFDLMLSSGASGEPAWGRIEIFRIGYYPDGDRKLVWKSGRLQVNSQRLDSSVASIGAGWFPTVRKISTRTWQSGYYTIDFVWDSGKRNTDVAYLVVTNESPSGDILVKISTNTYQAYNRFGGHSLYGSVFLGEGHKGQIVSFDRPTKSEFFQYQYYFVIWLEKLAQEMGLSVHYCTNFDVHSDKSFTENYKLFINVGHDEYWSKEEFDNTYNRIFGLGKNTMFLGANMAYWQVRYADVNGHKGSKQLGRQLISYKKEDDPIRYRSPADADLLRTQKFRDGSRRPETMLMGVAYCEPCWFDGKFTHIPYYVQDTDLPFFEGSGYREKEFVGNLIGYEWDNTDPEGDGKRLWDANKSLIGEIPRQDIHVIFSGKAIDSKGRERKAEAVYFESKAGAKVFSAGTLGWSWGLGKEGYEQEKFKLFNRNLVLYFLGRN